jgi:hypothetical protein
LPVRRTWTSRCGTCSAISRSLLRRRSGHESSLVNPVCAARPDRVRG